MTIGESSSAGLGSIICEGVPNTTGRPGKLAVFNWVQALDNNTRLVATDVPANVFGFFNGSMNTDVVIGPGGSEGNLCIAGGFIARFVGPGQIMSTGSAGTAELTPNLTAMPGPTGTVSVASGEPGTSSSGTGTLWRRPDVEFHRGDSRSLRVRAPREG